MESIGRYIIERELGRGAMGVVFRALDPAIGRSVAIKTIRLADFADPIERHRLRDRLLHEARSAGVLSHPGIVTIYDVAEQDDLAYIAMEFVNGPTIEQVLSRPQPPDPAAIFRVLREAASALDYAHKKGIVHRDIKPANIMIHEDGTVKITDFGVAKISASQLATQAGVVLGTPCYMSPEQALGKPVDGRSDQFSLAVIAFEMLTGEKPFNSDQLASLVYKIAHEGPPPVQWLNPTLGWQVELVLRRALEKGTAARFSTCAEFASALEASCGSSKGWKPLPRGGSQSLPTVVAQAAEEAPSPPFENQRQAQPGRAEGGRKAGRRNVVAGLLAAAALITVMGLGVTWLVGRRPAGLREQPSADEPAGSAAAGRPSPAGPAIPRAEPETPVTPALREQLLRSTKPEAAEPQAAPAPSAEERPRTRVATIPPRSEASSPVEATVLLRTSPPGADVVFDNNQQLACKSPCSLPLPPGRHTVSAILPGYRAALRIFQLPGEADLFLYLARMSGHVQVLSDPPGAAILIGGQQRSETTPATLELAAGKYVISVVREGYRRDEQEIEVRDNAFVRLNFSLGK
jgi:tRNA A-37 threonylcarbamoyl transferase component Bud32